MAKLLEKRVRVSDFDFLVPIHECGLIYKQKVMEHNIFKYKTRVANGSRPGRLINRLQNHGRVENSAIVVD